ncbi:MAG: hypothetical protein BWY83_01857 [bacterium ADurb.Bin478]|nr:MAG: hypothetical protein BWY83_01857 [bacterium ADurb.Bin478]
MNRFMRLSTESRNRLVLFALLLALGLIYWGGDRHGRHVNVDVTTFDQNGYLYYGRLLHDTGYAYIGDRNRLPAYPFLLSLIYQPGWTEEQFFQAGKRFSLFLTLVLLVVLFLILRRRLSFSAAVFMWLVSAFTVFIFKAAYVQADVLFYFLNFFLFLLMVRMFTQPDWKIATAAGVLFAINHLTKASVLPQMVAFVVIGGLKLIYEAWRGRQGRAAAEGWRVAGQWLLVPVLYLLLMSPYLRTSKQIFGRYFYNVNSTFYFWCDSTEEWKNGPKAHGDRFGWPDLAADEIPNARNYIRRYGLGHIGARLATGSVNVVKACYRSYGFLKYVLLYGLFAAAALTLNGRRALSVLRRHVFLLLFIAGLFIGYGILTAWWGYLGLSVRHILILFLPFLFCTSLILDRFSSAEWPFGSRRRIAFKPALYGLLSLLLAYDIVYTLAVRIVTMPAGK